MSAVAPDASVAKWLGQLKDVTVIQDADGNVLGTFTPNCEAEKAAVYEKMKQLIDPEQLQRIFEEQHGKGRPLTEIWRDLQAQEAKT